ncbi:MAG: alanine--glyoxylate aminotransferase family protein [Anaerolineaceae bacterium]|nr:alanine--glyoxylate aminotransferase family protein [Anaerolineaceae bacterium]
MKTYTIPMVPGPVQVPQEVLETFLVNYGASDIENEFLETYNATENQLKSVFGTQNQVAIMTGEGMIALWAGLKSCLTPGDNVLSIGTGLFGFGIGEMAKNLGCNVKTVGFNYDETINDWERIEKEIVEFAPKMITAVHCETPSGTLNPMEKLGQLKKKHKVPLFYVDTVASMGGTPVLADQWHIDLCLGGSQKCISAPANLAFLTVSPTAWDIIKEVQYVGYDALLPFKNAQRDFFFPYTPYWHGIAALHKALELLLNEGLENSCKRHRKTADSCRNQITDIGLELFARESAIPSPTVTAVKVPENISWKNLDTRFRKEGLVVGGNYGKLAGKVFRIGHMGTQANIENLNLAMNIIRKYI